VIDKTGWGITNLLFYNKSSVKKVQVYHVDLSLCQEVGCYSYIPVTWVFWSFNFCVPPCGEAHLVEMYVRLNVKFCFDSIQPRFHCHVEWIRLNRPPVWIRKFDRIKFSRSLFRKIIYMCMFIHIYICIYINAFIYLCVGIYR